ncbi:hypothetical protein BDQ12DRAFT_350170 [Crucibulum laeve]|uniref:Uncharacterized protein n=1 Tax=Crucibulum laeve TaxID=68775 RepID=A0A5C3MBJ3_9AGAR|nr:hypothetical protein BDQ12DRAFT_350170 [Crucibulum laeve]
MGSQVKPRHVFRYFCCIHYTSTHLWVNTVLKRRKLLSQMSKEGSPTIVPRNTDVQPGIVYAGASKNHGMDKSMVIAFVLLMFCSGIFFAFWFYGGSICRYTKKQLSKLRKRSGTHQCKTSSHFRRNSELHRRIWVGEDGIMYWNNTLVNRGGDGWSTKLPIRPASAAIKQSRHYEFTKGAIHKDKVASRPGEFHS